MACWSISKSDSESGSVILKASCKFVEEILSWMVTWQVWYLAKFLAFDNDANFDSKWILIVYCNNNTLHELWLGRKVSSRIINRFDYSQLTSLKSMFFKKVTILDEISTLDLVFAKYITSKVEISSIFWPS